MTCHCQKTKEKKKIRNLGGLRLCKKFSDNTFGEVLTLLNKEDKKVFAYHPKTVSGGFNSEFYMDKLYKLLGVDYRMYDYNVSDHHLFFSYLNEEFNRIEYRILRKKLKIYVNENKIFKYTARN